MGSVRIMAKGKQFDNGDHVSWNSRGKTVTGEVTKKIMERAEVAGRTVDASKDEPQYEVKSDKSGRRAVHKPESLRKEDNGS